MKKNLNVLVENLNFNCLSCFNLLNRGIYSFYTSDILSDVLSEAEEGALWITSRTHKNIIAIAHLKKLCSIVISGCRYIDKEVVDLAEKEHVPIFVSNLSTFETSGIIYNCFFADNS